jgi:hypothetical protein
VTDMRSDRKTEPKGLDTEEAIAATLQGIQKGKEVYSNPTILQNSGLAPKPKPLFSMMDTSP